MATYTGIKRDTTFPIVVGGNTLINLQKLLLYILADKSEQEIQTAYEKILRKEFDEEWYEHYAFVGGLIAHIEHVAKNQGLTVDEEITPSQSEN